MNRKPPTSIRQRLRKEIGFGCPVNGCGRPYLYWHHFDPPWNVREHHDPDGMIALCGEHHDKADAGAYTRDQLREFKRVGAARAEAVKGRFEWMRHNLLAVVGGSFYYEQPIIFQFHDQRIIWFNRDEDGHLLLNVRMPSKPGEPRMQIEDNFWIERGNPEDLQIPPSGKLLHVKYSNGDMLKVQFFKLESFAKMQKRYPEARPHEDWDVPFPITAVEVQSKIREVNTEFGPRYTNLPGVVIKGAFMSRNRGAAIHVTQQGGISIG